MDVAQYLAGDPHLLLDGDLDLPALGIQSKLEYKNVIINQGGVVDRVFIKSIGGLGDPDLRLVNEPNPGAHGETPYDSFYGGRTLTLNGQIEAAKFSKSETMKRGLKALFNDLAESPLIFRTGDPSRDVMINCRKGQPIAMDDQQDGFYIKRPFQIFLRASDPRFVSYIEENQSFAIGIDDQTFADLTKYDQTAPANVQVVGGNLQQIGSSGISKQVLYNAQNFLDPRSTINIVNGTVNAGQSSNFGIPLKYIDINNRIYVQFNRTSSAFTVTLWKAVNTSTGTNIAWDTQSFVPTTALWPNGGSRWIQAFVVGNQVTVSIFDQDPSNPGAVGLWSGNKLLTGGDATALGAGIQGKVGPATSWFSSEAAGATAIIGWRASSASAFASTVFNADNKGDWLAEPTFKIYGPIQANTLNTPAATITNLLTGQSIIIKSPANSTSAIPAGSYIKIDTRDTGGRKIQEFNATTNALIGNRFDRLDINSEMVKLAPGRNPIQFSMTFGNITRLDMAYRHTFL